MRMRKVCEYLIDSSEARNIENCFKLSKYTVTVVKEQQIVIELLGNTVYC